MIQSFGSEATFRWDERGKNHTLGANESHPGCQGCLCHHVLCDVHAEEEETVDCHALLLGIRCMFCGCTDEGKEKGTRQLYEVVQPDSRILITYNKHLICS